MNADTVIAEFARYAGTTIGYSALYSLGNALLLMLGVRVVAKYWPKYWIAYCVAFISAVAAGIVGYLMGFGLAVSGASENITINAIIGFIAGFIIGAAINGAMFKHPTSGPIGFLKGAVLSIVQVTIAGVLIGIVWLIEDKF